MNNVPITLVGIAGSLREKSFNRALLREAAVLSPPGMSVDIWDRLGEVPPYNQDVEDRGIPEVVAHLKKMLSKADGLLVVTPEYNYSIPGVLKNALDWVSRPAGSSPLRNLPAGVIGASQGKIGTARAQLALRQMFVFTHTLPAPAGEVLISQAQNVFDSEGRFDVAPKFYPAESSFPALLLP